LTEPRIVERRTLCRGRRFEFCSAIVEYGGRRFSRDLLLHPGAVVAIPFLGEEKIVLLRQWRPGCNCWLYELPAGTLEPNESPEETIRRELVEETGYRPGQLELLGYFYPSPGVSTEKIYVYAAYKLEHVGARPEEDEILKPIVVEFDRALKMVLEGEIVDGKTMIALMLYAMRERERIL